MIQRRAESPSIPAMARKECTAAAERDKIDHG
jgi:hypothetical protein